MVPVDDAGQAATEPQARIAATASSANQLTSKRTIVPGINLFFMAISGKSNPRSGPSFTHTAKSSCGPP
jgi:hypothetical protein